MWQHFFDHTPSGGAVKDYSLATVLTTAPIWGTYLANINLVLTFAGLVVGLWLGIRRLRRDYKKDQD